MSKKNSSLARNIKRLRKEKGFSQDKLSKKADVTYHTIAKLESGENDNPTVKTIQKIADALGVRLALNLLKYAFYVKIKLTG